MKRTLLAVLVMVMTVAAVASLMARRARAEIRVFTTVLLPSNEVAPVVVHPSEAAGSGLGTLTLDTTANTARFEYSLIGFASNTTVILTHIHEGAAGVNGPVRIDSGITPGTAIPLSNGAGSITRTGSASASAISAVIANPANFYFNVHTALSPSGVCRGQLAPQQIAGVTAPTLSEWGAILMFLLLAAVATYFLLVRRPVVVGAGADELVVAAPHRAIGWLLFAKVAMYVEAVVGLGLLAASASALDVAGALASGLIAAFIIHLMIGAKRH